MSLVKVTSLSDGMFNHGLCASSMSASGDAWFSIRCHSYFPIFLASDCSVSPPLKTGFVVVVLSVWSVYFFLVSAALFCPFSWLFWLFLSLLLCTVDIMCDGRLKISCHLFCCFMRPVLCFLIVYLCLGSPGLIYNGFYILFFIISFLKSPNCGLWLLFLLLFLVSHYPVAVLPVHL